MVRDLMRIAPLLLAPLALLLASCEAPSAIKVVDVAGGKREHITIIPGGTKPAEDDNAIVEFAAVVPIQQTKRAGHAFIVKPKIKSPIVHIVVSEITQDPARVLIDQKNPTLTTDGYWRATTDPLTAADAASIEWVNHQSNTMLVYETQITFENGKKSRLVSGYMVPPFVKVFIKKDLGL